ncbi:MAG: cell division FtsA domain-containing protein [Flavobacteriaceae bacterium]|nr:cell division FtsA domain-containing protein [Flavobacteriaceae bacterium]
MSDDRPVFRIHEGIPGEGWFQSTKIDNDQLNTIKTDSIEVATSIPSPFAQIDLVKTAFKRVTENNGKGEPILGIEGNTAHHKLVSDVFDIGRLFYLSKKYEQEIKITSWSHKKRFRHNKQSKTKGHRNCFKTMDIYWSQDQNKSKSFGLYNFESLETFYFILNGKNNKIIGATSPITLFFAAPDAKKNSEELNLSEFHHDNFFDDKLQPLHKQEHSFIIYIYTLSKQQGFAEKFPEVYDYLEVVRENFLSPEIRQEVNNLKPKDTGEYEPCHVSENPQEYCEVLGIQLGLQEIQNRKNQIQKTSDFVIKSEIDTGNEFRPLILPNTKFKHNWVYTTKGDLWNIDNRILPKHFEDLRQGERFLPYNGDVYPWYSADDFLEDKIVKLPYSIDNSFIPSHLKDNQYLIPLKPLFFEYFKVESITKYFQLKNYADGVIEVILKIPVKNGSIEFKKEYTRSDSISDLGNIHLSVFPFFKPLKEYSINYYIGLLDDRSNILNDEVQLHFFSQGKKISVSNDSVSTRSAGDGELASKYHKTNSFDMIQLSTDRESGLIIPQFKEKNNTKEIHFAIDFGTTNTHIEYKLGDKGDSEILSNRSSDSLWKSLLDRNRNEIKNLNQLINNEDTFDQETIPYRISFPIRTAMVNNRGLGFNEELELFLKINNYLLLEKKDIPNYLNLTTHLKWGNFSTHQYQNKVRSYVRYLLTIVYYKALQLEANPKKTKITWLYPVSMSEDDEINDLKGIWRECYKEVFGIQDDNNLYALQESLGPYLYNLSNTVGQTLTMDIGGGSTDIAVFREDNAQFISSFKFGGNAIFGDGYSIPEYSRNSDENGFVLLFKENLINFKNSKDVQIESILNRILEKKESIEFSNFAFSLKKSSVKYDYISDLKKEPILKPVFLTFFGALVYYSAVLMKQENSEAPKNIIFSGGGSNLIHVIDFSEDYVLFKKYIQVVFEKVYKSELVLDKIIISDEPKKVTCKGALKQTKKDLKVSPKFWHGGINAFLYKSKDESSNFHYSEIGINIKNDIENSIKEFYRIHDLAVDKSRIWKDSTRTIKRKYHEWRDKYLPQYLDRGLESYFKKDKGEVNETLFFYPLIGVLNDLAFELSKIKK